nr:DUF3606 domain-containing protein [uncultured Pseudoxanthomonas sp.]
MSDDPNNTGSPDRERINVNEDHELRYWSEALGVTRERLRSVVEAVGTSVAAVRRHLDG